MDRAFPVKEKKFQQIEGVITGRGHEFLQPGERRSGRVIDSYPIEIGGGSGGGGGMLVGFNPAECDGVALHVRLPADDRILVRHRASIVIKAHSDEIFFEVLLLLLFFRLAPEFLLRYSLEPL